MDNLEKLIQITTIEHMYSMLQKMQSVQKSEVVNLPNENSCLKDWVLSETTSFRTIVDTYATELNDHILRNNNEHYEMVQTIKILTEKINKLEHEIYQIKHNNQQNSDIIDITFSVPTTEDNIKLIVEEEHIVTNNTSEKTNDLNEENVVNEKVCVEAVNTDITEKEEVKTEVKVEKTEVEDEVEVEEDADEVELEEDEVEVEEDADEVELEEDADEVELEEDTDEVELEEDEVELEEDTDEVELEEDTDEVELEEDEVEEEVENKKDTKEEEEEVFEIEIDDVTYFATSEENGILYEITDDNDIGKKVGIIKDGEPIFN